VVAGFEWLVVALVALLFMDVLWGVVSRYVFGRQSPWTEELAVNLLLWVSLLGAALTYREHGHLGVDYFTGKLAPPARRLAAIIAEVAVLIFGGFGLVYGGGMLVAQTLAANQLSAAMGWKVGYFYSAVPFSGVFFVLFSVEHLVRLFRQPEPVPDRKKGME
jgi:TRAP-type C4-dicarboxylate transport system permease small subunit